MPHNSYSNKSRYSFSGVKSGNFLRSSGDDCCDFFDCQKVCSEHANYPQDYCNSVNICRCGTHQIPFFLTSNALYQLLLANNVGGTTPLTTTLAADPDNFYRSSAANYGITTLNAENNVNVDSKVVVNVPSDAEPGIVLDLHEITLFAQGIYNNQTATSVVATLPGAGSIVNQTNVGIAASLQRSTNPLAAPTSGTAAVYNKDNLRQIPTVVVHNKSYCPVYLLASGGAEKGCAGKYTFEGVSPQMSVRPLEKLELSYDAASCQWKVCDTNSRA